MKELTSFTRSYIEITDAIPKGFVEMLQDRSIDLNRQCKVSPYGLMDAVFTKGLFRWNATDVRRSITYRVALWRLPLQGISDAIPDLEPEIYFLMRYSRANGYGLRMFVRQDFYNAEPTFRRQVLKAKLAAI